MAGETILTSPLFIEMILPFVLVFTVVFAILQKSKLLGDGKKQIDAIVSLVIALIVVSFANATGIIISLMPFLAVAVVVILVFLILYSMGFQGEDKFELSKGIRIALGIVVLIAVVIAVMIATGAWDYLKNEWLFGDTGSSVVVNGIFIIIVIAAIVVAVSGGKGKDKKKD